MSKTKWIMTGALFAVAVFALVLAPTSALAAKKNMAKVKGHISAVDAAAGTVTIQDKTSGEQVTVGVGEATRIHKNKVEGAAIEDLAVGDKAKAKYNAETGVAKRIGAKSPKAKVRGEITANDLAGMSVNIQPAAGPAITVLVTKNTKIKRSGEPATFADLVVGNQAKARYDPATMTAKRIRSRGK